MSAARSPDSLDTHAPPTISGLVRAEPHVHAARIGATVVDFDAHRGDPLTPRRWLETVVAFDGASQEGCRQVARMTLERSGLNALADLPLSRLSPFQRASLAIAEVAARSIARVASVVVPAPPFPLPARTDLRRLAVALLNGRDVVLHADDPSELSPLLGRAAIVDGEGRSAVVRAGVQTFAMRVWATPEPYLAWRAAVEALGATLEGGPVAHLLSLPEGTHAHMLLAAAHVHDVDVLEMTPIG